MRTSIYSICFLKFLFVSAACAYSTEEYIAKPEEGYLYFYTFFIGGCHVPVPIYMSVNGDQKEFKFYDSRKLFDEKGLHRTISASSDFNINESPVFLKMDKNVLLSNGDYQLARFISSELRVAVYALIKESDAPESKPVVMFHNFLESDVIFSYKYCIEHKEYINR